MENNHNTKPTSLPLRRALHIATSLALGTMGQTASADIYVMGASYASLNPNVYAAPVGIGDPAGNVTATNGDTWIALLASATSIGQPRPVSSAITPGAGETATNFARSGAEIINSLPGAAGVDRPKDASEQFVELTTALGTTSPAASDIFAITAFGNDIVYQYEKGTQGNVTTAFIDQRVAAIKQIIESAIALGFTKVLVANMPRIDLLPGVSVMMNPSVLNALKADIDYYNQQADSMLNTLATAYPVVTFMVSDIASVFANVTANPTAYNFVDAISTAYDANTGTPTGVDPTTVMWWDGFHPTQALHQQIANNIATIQPQTTTSASGSTGGGGSFGLTGLLALLLACLPVTIMRLSRTSDSSEERRP